MLLAVSQAQSRRAEETLLQMGEPFYAIGKVVGRKRGGPRVVYR
jgi:hypothetical protein